MSVRQSGYAQKRRQSKLAISAFGGRTLETRGSIIEAARDAFLKNGYAGTRVEDIIESAGISRPTFYRYFEDKFDVAKAYHAQSRDETMGPWTKIRVVEFRNVDVIRDWLEKVLDAFAGKRDELKIWAEMSSVEPDYLLRMPRQIPALIEALGKSIPAFARAQAQAQVPPNASQAEQAEPGPVWVEAYLLLEHLSYYCTWLALGKHIVSRRQLIDYFSRRFFRFIERYESAAADGEPGFG